MTQKELIRTEILRKRDAIAPGDKLVRDERIENRLFALTEFADARTIMFFASFRSEPDTLRMISKALASGKRVAVPKVDRDRRKLVVYEIRTLADLAPGYMGIPEPVVGNHNGSGNIVEPQNMDVIIMPGVAFDSAGGRVGYGGGYYDGLLADMPNRKVPQYDSPDTDNQNTQSRQRAVLIAIAYCEQLLDSVPMLPHDVRVDILVTDSQTIRVH